MKRLLMIIPIISIFFSFTGIFPQKASAASGQGTPPIGLTLLRADQVQLTELRVDLSAQGSEVLVSFDYRLANTGPDQEVRIGIPTPPTESLASVSNLTVQVDGVPARIRSFKTGGAGGDQGLTTWKVFGFSLRHGQAAAVTGSYLVTLPADASGGYTVFYPLTPSAMWAGPVSKATVSVQIEGFKPYFDLSFPCPEVNMQPASVSADGRIQFSVSNEEPQKDICVYYRSEGPEAILSQLASLPGAAALREQAEAGDYEAALNALASFRASDNLALSDDAWHLLNAYFLCSTKEFSKAEEELSKVNVHSPAWIYYKVVSGVGNRNSRGAGEALKEIDSLQLSPGSSSLALLKRWSQDTIKKSLTRPVAPVPAAPPAAKGSPYMMVITVAVIALASAAITWLWRRR